MRLTEVGQLALKVEAPFPELEDKGENELSLASNIFSLKNTMWLASSCLCFCDFPTMMHHNMYGKNKLDLLSKFLFWTLSWWQEK